MRGLKAALGKDLRLFRSGTGLICLLLPLCLLLALRAGGGDMVERAYLEPFPIAVRDEDGTVMSRSITSQMAKVELFSQVMDAGEESDEELLAAGCAAVVTIPKDLFYTLYDMRENPVRVVLNGEMPLEAALFRSVFSSVMEIVSADQAAGRAVFRFCYGDLPADRQWEMWGETANRLVLDALGRQQIFDSASQGADLRGSLERSFLACALSVLCLFFPLAGVKTLPEEMGSGVLPRFLAVGGSPWAFFFSKFLTSALLALPSLALVLPAVPAAEWPLVLLEGAVLFLGAFGLLLFIAAWAGEAAAAQRWGNVVVLLSLTLGGAVYPLELFPGFVQTLGRLTLPYYARLGLETIHAGGGAGALMARLWPVCAAGLALGFTAAWMLRQTGRTLPQAPEQRPAPMPGQEPPPVALWRRLLPTAGRKVWAMSGGRAGFACLLAVSLGCGALAGYAVGRTGPESLTLAVAEEEPDLWSRELVDRLSAQDGVRVLEMSAEEGRALLGSGRIEGLLVIGEDYGARLAAEETPLTYISAAPALSAQAAREIVAGQAAGQRARIRGLSDAAARLGRPLTGEEETDLLSAMTREAAEAPPLYEIVSGPGGGRIANPFAPKLLGFAALAVMLTVLTWGAWVGGTDQRLVESRMASLRGGRALSYLSDAAALYLVGLAVGLCALLPGGAVPVWELLALGTYVYCVASLTLAVVRLTAAAERMDALAPFVALITCLLGGCFGDLGQISPALGALSLCTPQGLALAAGAGSLGALAVLAGAGTLLLWLGRPRQR